MLQSLKPSKTMYWNLIKFFVSKWIDCDQLYMVWAHANLHMERRHCKTSTENMKNYIKSRWEIETSDQLTTVIVVWWLYSFPQQFSFEHQSILCYLGAGVLGDNCLLLTLILKIVVTITDWETINFRFIKWIIHETSYLPQQCNFVASLFKN